MAIKHNASDVHLRSGEAPTLRIKGELVAVQAREFSLLDITEICKIIFGNQKIIDQFDELKEFDGSFNIPNLCRLRFNFFRFNQQMGIIFRIIKTNIPDIDSLGLPSIIKKLALTERGLILVTGATGTGKSTTLASMINYINNNSHSHVLTLEDPVEFLHPQINSRISQREIGKDTENFTTGLRAALRQDPDVILIGEMRDPETIDIALKASETGHAVFSTLHTSDAVSTIGRIISMFHPSQQEEIKKRLATNLKATIGQRMLKKADNSGVVLAMEIMLNNPGVRECILGQAPLSNLTNVISKQKELDGSGGQTYDQNLMELYDNKIITKEVALSAASNQSDFAQKIMMEE